MAQEAHALDQVASRRARPLRRLGQARQRRRAARPARRRRRARRRRLARPRLVRCDLPRRVPLVTLVILDGWGCAPPGPGNAVELADTPVFDRLWRDVPAHDARGVRRGGRAAAGPDGQLRGRPPDDRLRTAALPGSDAREQGDRGRLVLRERRRSSGVRARPARPPARARLARRRPLAHRPPPRAAPVRAREDVDPRVHRRPRRLAARGSSRISPSCRATGSRRSSAATRRWTATSAGIGRSARTTRSLGGVGIDATDAGRRGRGELRRRCHRRVHRADRRSTARHGSSPATPRSSSTSGPTGPVSSRGCCSTHGVDLTTMTRYARDLDEPVAFAEQKVPETLAEVLVEARARASCTSPRPRSTPTSPTSSTAA